LKNVLLLLLALVLTVSCALPGSLTGLLEKLRPQSPTAESSDLLDLVTSGKVQVISAHGNQGVTSVNGRTIDLQLYNPTSVALKVNIPCGLIFTPTVEGPSRMMAVQSHSVVIEVDEVKTVKPFVLSMDSLKGLPTPEKTYTVGMLSEGKQLTFANCLCQRDLPAETETRDLITLQLAAWMIADQSLLTDVSDELNDFLRYITGIPFDLPGLDKTLKNLIGNLAPEAQAWLDKCSIK
jgi:hypothetical protein